MFTRHWLTGLGEQNKTRQCHARWYQACCTTALPALLLFATSWHWLQHVCEDVFWIDEHELAMFTNTAAARADIDPDSVLSTDVVVR
jgi:hypothetical protein